MAAKKADTKAKDEEKQEPEEVKEEKEEEASADDRYEKLEEQVGKLSTTVSEQNEFIQGATTVINTIAYNPELKQKFQETYDRNMGVSRQSSGEQSQQGEEKREASDVQQNQTSTDKRVTQVEISQREEIVANFEEQAGIDRMKDEDKKEVRKQVETYLNDFGWSVRDIPLPQLRNSLEKAYEGTQVAKLKEEGKIEGVAQMRANQSGTMGGMQDKSVDNDTFSDLTAGQKTWLKNLRVDESGAKKTYQSKDEEYQRVPKSEKNE